MSRQSFWALITRTITHRPKIQQYRHLPDLQRSNVSNFKATEQHAAELSKI